ncbi:AraC family transcriptional regulator [Mangrovivirga sp. M17]|uniref:AraC family transcriptional regulator n=1 Tax=Mangrovivirga halotolerans TaxID=2993936 RepID=A0ABT3RPG9_9BACT|nr:AraC family transcriptional regulator [Mangrovivirga halotolerans]MCX2743259.1 AraC family transcriptional regulator [Mangrovivirga halotolerans]
MLTDENILNAVKYIESNFDSDPDINILSDIACYSPVHFRRLFKNQTGYSPAKYLEMTRISKSIELIRAKAPVREIAFDTGFNNYETFIRTFKKYSGIAPGDLINLLKVLEQDTDKDQPVIIVHQNVSLIQTRSLLKNSLEENLFSKDKIQDLKVFRITESTLSARKITDKFSFHDDLVTAQKILQSY